MSTSNEVADDGSADEEDEPDEPDEPEQRSEKYCIRGAKLRQLREALEKRGWVEEDEESTRYGLFWTIKAKITDALIDSGNARKRTLLNHYQRAWALITKHRLAENVRALPAFEDVDVDTIAPPTYYVKDVGQLREFMSDYCVSIAQQVLAHAASN